MQTSSSTKPKKKSRNDLIRAAVGNFLKETSRVGNEKYRKSDFVLSQNKTEFVFRTMLQSDLCGGGNAFSYSNVVCTTNNFHLVDQQFARFSQFVESQSGFIRTELRRLYGPMVCHLYIDLLKAREAKPAADFIKKYAHLVAPVETYEAPLPTKINGCSVAHQAESPSSSQNTCIKFTEDLSTVEEPEREHCMRLIQILSAASKLETLEADNDVALFRSSKFEIYTLEEVVDALRNYFEKRGHVLILNLIYTWIHVHIIDNEVSKWTEDAIFLQLQEEEEEMQGSIQNPEEMMVDKENFLPQSLEEVKLEQEKEATKEVIDAEPKNKGSEARVKLKQLPQLREKLLATQVALPKFIKIPSKCGRTMVAADLDADECHMVAGFNNSVVQLWQLNQITCIGRNLYQRFANKLCRWEINNCCEQEEEEDKIAIDIENDARTGGCKNEQNKFNAAKFEDNSMNNYGGVELRGHGEGVTDVKFSMHYPLILSVSKDCTMRVWRAESYTTASVYRGHRYPIWCVTESPVGQYVATGSEDLTARLWSIDREFPFVTYVGHTQSVESIAFHPNGNYIATGSADSSVRLWCVTSGKLMRVFSDCKEAVTCVAFSRDGKLLAAAGEESKIRIFDLAGGSQLFEIKDQASCVNSIAWSANDEHFVNANQDGYMHLWSLKKSSSTIDGPSTSAAALAGSSSSSSLTPTNLLSTNYECQRLVRVKYTKNHTLCCLGV